VPDIKQGLRAILEGTAVTQNGEIYLNRNNISESDNMYSMLESDFQTLEEAYFYIIEEAYSNHSIYETIMNASTDELYSILSEAGTTDPGFINIIFKKIRDDIRAFLPSKAVRNLKVVREHLINTWLTSGQTVFKIALPLSGLATPASIPAIGGFMTLIYLTRRLLNIKFMTAREAKEALNEAENLKADMEKVHKKLVKDGRTKEAEKIKAQIREIDIAIGTFREKYAISLGK